MKSTKKIYSKVGSKLFLSGEYSIIFPQNKAIILHIPKHTYSTIYESPQLHIYSNIFDYAITNLHNDHNYQLIIDTIIFMQKYLTELNIKCPNFTLNIESDLYHNKQKYGLGSSGAIVVLIIKSLLKLCSLSYSPLLLFKLSTIFLTLRKDNGSFSDIACICYKTNVVYTNFDRSFINHEQTITSLINNDFNQLNISTYHFKFPISMAVVWSKISADSKQFINKITVTPTYVSEINKLINDFINCDSPQNFQTLIAKNRFLLQQLSPEIEIPVLTTICDTALEYHCFGKSSGAGGGDCATIFGEKHHLQLLQKNISYPIIMEVTYE